MSYEREEVRMETKGVVELKQASTCKLEAVIATLNAVDSDGDLLLPGSFGTQEVPFIWSHRQDSLPLGRAKVSERGDQVLAEVDIVDKATCEWLRLDFSKGPVQQFSWGFTIPAGGAERRDDGVRVISAVDLIEVSGVLRGASVGTRTVGIKGAKSACCDACGSGEGMCADELARVIEECVAEIKRKGVYGWKLARAHPTLQRKVDAGAAAMGIESPLAFTMERVIPASKADVRTTTEVSGLMVESPEQRDFGRRCILVVEGLGVEDELLVAGHELSHAWEFVHGLEPDEKACEEYGRKFAAACVYGTHLPTSPRQADA